MSFRIAAIYVAQPDMDYLESSLRSLSGALDLVLIGADERYGSVVVTMLVR